MRFPAAVSGAVVVAGVFVAFTLVARAVVFTVDTTANGAGVPPGAVSLAGVVSGANGLEGVDPIEFAPGTNRGDAEVQRSTMLDAVHFKCPLQVSLHAWVEAIPSWK